MTRPLAADEQAVFEFALRRSGVKIAKPMTLDEHRPQATWSGTTDEAIRLLESWLYDPCQDEHQQARDLERLIRSLHRRYDMPDSILQSALWGRLMAAGLSGVSAVLLFLDQANAALGAALAIVAAAAAAGSKLREWLKTQQSR